MAAEIKRDPDIEWIDFVRPVGLVVAPVLLKELGLAPLRQTQADTAVIAAHVGGDSSKPGFGNPWKFFEEVLGWGAKNIAGSPGGPALPEDFHVRLPDHDTTLNPTWAVRELGIGDKNWQLLVRIEKAGTDPDGRGALEGWEATAHQRFERLLRETGTFAGLLITEKKEVKDGEDHYTPELRLIYAPSGETSGHLTFPLRALATVAGRPMLGGLKLLLDSVRLFTDADERRLPALLRQSREAQAAVSTALAEQVLGALHELLRGFDAAEPNLIRELALTRPGHLYEGLLTVLMRLVFILYAEDRDLLPSRQDGRAREIYETSYSARGLYARLVEDAAINPDTMDERRGGWGRLLSLFRLIHKGHPSHFVQARGGKLFNQDEFPFLEGRIDSASPARIPAVSDGCILRILEGLMTLKSGSTRERVSYRALDVQQIGSVYETVMGFTVETAAGRGLSIKAGKHNRTPVFVDLEKLIAAKGKDRIKFLKEQADRGQLSANVGKAIEGAKTVADIAAALDPIVDERGSPRKHEIASGTPILQPTDERRRTGSHYTPRSLTEPIVRYALEPAFERLGPDARPEQILDLKVCDPAMGSGAFLVEACRALAVRLVAAWNVHKDKKPAIPPDEDEELHARRLVAQRCLYGVDKNPLATDLAKLSLWLATLARDHEFSFLDHALKSGDSLVGLTLAQIAAAHWDTSKPGLPLFRQLVKDRIAEAMKGRAEIQTAPDDTARAIQEQRHKSLEARLKEIRLMADAVIATFFAEDKPKAREKKRAEVESWLGGSPIAWDKLAAMEATLKQGRYPVTPLHWEIEFPEVFARENGGFDAIVGNPPFAGGNTLSAANRPNYTQWLQNLHEHVAGNADLVAHYFRRAFALLSVRGTFGLIATSRIGQGDTREAGLAFLLEHGGVIRRAIRRLRWPGEAAVVVSVVHLGKSGIGVPTLDGRPVRRISAYLVNGDLDRSPAPLSANAKRAFQGSIIHGIGFTFDNEEFAKGSASSLDEMKHLIDHNGHNAECIVPLIGAQEVNGDPTHAHHRYVINFADYPLRREPMSKTWKQMTQRERDVCLRVGVVPKDYVDHVAADWPELLKIVERLVKPERQDDNRKSRRERWWRFGDRQPGLYAAIATLPRTFATGAAAVMHHMIAELPSEMVFSHKMIVFSLSARSSFACLQTTLHELWSRQFGTTFGSVDALTYNPTQVFMTFPFPHSLESSADLEAVGGAYHDHRATLMVARNEGMTKTYNRFHDPTETAKDIQRLRELHAAMDYAMFEAYGWDDLAVRSLPVFLDETNEDDHIYQGRLFWPSDFRDEVLARLLALNAERRADEVRLGVAPGMKGGDEVEDEGDEE
jgi:N-6 DNA Methylase